MPFPKGTSGNSSGRPKNPRWSKLEYWFNELQNDLKDERLKIRDKAYIELECIKLILGKKPGPAKTPTDSASNAQSALNLLKRLEGKKDGAKPVAAIDSRKDSVAPGRPDLQALPNPKIDAGGLGSEQKPQ